MQMTAAETDAVNVVKENRHEEGHSSAKAGQALIESCLVIALLALILFGVFQVSQLYASKEILEHAAIVGARARSVGFNNFMVYKATRVAAIPNAGHMLEPVLERIDGGIWGDMTPGEAWNMALSSSPDSPQYNLEQSRIPLYLGATHYGDLHSILDYAAWDTFDVSRLLEIGDDMLRVDTRQTVPLRFPFHRTFYAADDVSLEGECGMDSHYRLYLQ